MTKQNNSSPIGDVASPCISVCVLDLNDICEGCFRTMKEISHWSDFDNSRRREVLGLCWERAEEAGKTF